MLIQTTLKNGYSFVTDCESLRVKEGDLFCFIHVCGDARVYIHRLENHIGELTEKVEQLEATHPKLGRKGTF